MLFKSSRACVIQFVCALGIVAMTFSACGKPFDVKPKIDLPPARYMATNAVEGISIQAQAITDEDLLYNAFDANLISAGVLPVRVMVKNLSGQPVDLGNTRFEIRQQSAREFKAVKARQAYKRLISYYEIKAYNKDGYKKSLGTFSEYGIDLKTPLEAGQSRQGMLFFIATPDAARGTGLVMAVRRIGPDKNSQMELKLN
jgi:hypothetical protein